MFTYMRFTILGARCNFGIYKHFAMKHAVLSSNTFSEQVVIGTQTEVVPIDEPIELTDKKEKIKEREENDCEERIAAIGMGIKSLRVHRGYSSAEIFAYEHDLNRVSYWRMEKGSNITLKSLIRILDIHKVSLKEFFQDFD